MIQVFNNYGAASASLTKFFKGHSQLAGHDLSRNMSRSSSQVPSMVNFDKGKQSGFNQGSAFYVPARESLKPKAPSKTTLVSVVPTSTDMAGLTEMIGGPATCARAQERGGDAEKGGLLEILERKEQGLDEFPNRTKVSSLCLPTDAVRISRRPWELGNTASSASHSRRAGPPHVLGSANPSRHQLGTGNGTAPRIARNLSTGTSKMDVVGPAHLVVTTHQGQAGQPSIALNSKETTKTNRETNTEHCGMTSRLDSVALNDKLKKAQNPASQQTNEETGRSATEKRKVERNEKNLLERLRTELPQVRQFFVSK
jgi:hypothetical protein